MYFACFFFISRIALSGLLSTDRYHLFIITIHGLCRIGLSRFYVSKLPVVVLSHPSLSVFFSHFSPSSYHFEYSSRPIVLYCFHLLVLIRFIGPYSSRAITYFCLKMFYRPTTRLSRFANDSVNFFWFQLALLKIHFTQEDTSCYCRPFIFLPF